MGLAQAIVLQQDGSIECNQHACIARPYSSLALLPSHGNPRTAKKGGLDRVRFLKADEEGRSKKGGGGSGVRAENFVQMLYTVCAV